MAQATVASTERAHPLLTNTMQSQKVGGTGCGSFGPALELPDPATAALRQTPCIRVPDFLSSSVAEELHVELREGIEYERVELGELTSQWRAVRPVGDVYFGPMCRRPGWRTSTTVANAIESFESAPFVSWLSQIAGENLTFLRPMTAYRMVQGDRLCLHDDMSSPEHAVSVAYNLSPDWEPEWGGATIFGEVTGTTALPTPTDSPIDLREWHVTNEQRFVPKFNSLLVMKLSTRFAHGVDQVLGNAPRLALVGIYGRAAF
jgi:hypothetical protein